MEQLLHSKTRKYFILSTVCYKGIHYTRDILDDHGKILNWQSAGLKFDLHNKDIMAWLSLIKSIPVNWKRKLRLLIKKLVQLTVEMHSQL